MKIKENIESGMYFKFKEVLHKPYTDYVYNVEIDDKGGYHRLNRYHCHSVTGEYLYVDGVTLRRVGETSMDYYTYDMFGKKTRGRIHYSEIDSFFYVKDKQTKIEKCPVPGIDAIAV